MAADRPSRRVCMHSSRTRRVLRTVLVEEDELDDEEEKRDEEEEEEAADEDWYCWLKLLAARFSDW